MPKGGDLVRRLRRAGFVLLRHGGNHDVWEHPQTRRRVSVPRHAGDLARGTYLAILRRAGIAD